MDLWENKNKVWFFTSKQKKVAYSLGKGFRSQVERPGSVASVM